MRTSRGAESAEGKCIWREHIRLYLFISDFNLGKGEWRGFGLCVGADTGWKPVVRGELLGFMGSVLRARNFRCGWSLYLSPCAARKGAVARSALLEIVDGDVGRGEKDFKMQRFVFLRAARFLMRARSARVRVVLWPGKKERQKGLALCLSLSRYRNKISMSLCKITRCSLSS